MHFLFLFLPSACTSCYKKVHAEGMNKKKKYMLKEGIKNKKYKLKRHTQKDGLKTRNAC
jgi:hypothetical protein